jgi:hypothetical protein
MDQMLKDLVSQSREWRNVLVITEYLICTRNDGGFAAPKVMGGWCGC